jgi:hypothetical protein
VLEGFAVITTTEPIAQVGYGVSVLSVQTADVTGISISVLVEPPEAVIPGINPTAPVATGTALVVIVF